MLRLAYPSLLLLLATPAVAGPNDTVLDIVAVIGDSATSGAVSNPHWDFSTGMLNVRPPTAKQKAVEAEGYRQVFTDLGLNPRYVLTNPTWLTSGPLNADDKGKLVQQILFDTRQFTPAYMAGRVLGVNPTSIHFYSRHHAFVRNYHKQIETLTLANNGRLPSLTLLAGSSVLDFCSNSVLTDPEKRQRELYNYQSALKKSLTSLGELKQPDWYRRRVVVFAPLPLADILRSESIRDKKVKAFHKSYSCEEFRTTADITIAGTGTNLIAQLNKTCSLMMTTSWHDTKKIAEIDALIKDIVKVQEKVVAEVNDDPAMGGAEFMVFKGTQQIVWEEKDIAADCLHPSIYANAKIARKLIDFLKAN